MLNYKVSKRDGNVKIFEINVEETSKNIGIEEDNPQATLDINGNLRIQKIDTVTGGTPNLKRLVVDEKGVIHSTSSSDTPSGEKFTENGLKAEEKMNIPITYDPNKDVITISLLYIFKNNNNNPIFAKLSVYYGNGYMEVSNISTGLSSSESDENKLNLSHDNSKMQTSISVTSSNNTYFVNMENTGIIPITVKYNIETHSHFY